MQAILLRGPDDMDETFEFNQADRDLYETEALCYVNADDHDAFTRIVIPHVDTEGFAWDGLLQLIEEGDQLTLLQKDPADPDVTVTQRSDFITVGQETINSESYNTEIEYDSEQPDHTPYFGEPVVFRFKALVNVPNDREVYYQDTPPNLNDNPGLSEGNLWVDSNTNLEYVWNGSAWEQISTDFAYVHCIENTHSEYVQEVVYRRKSDGFFYTMVRGNYNGAGNPTTLSQFTFGSNVDVSLLRVGGQFTLTKGNNTDIYSVTGLTPGTERGYNKMTVDVIGPSTTNNTYYLDDKLDFAVILPEVVSSCLKCDPEEDETICDQLETLHQDIITLEEEIESIAPSTEFGLWYFEQPTGNLPELKPPGPGKFFILSGATANNGGLGASLTTDYQQANAAVFHNNDWNDGDPTGPGNTLHSWDTVEVGEIIDILDKPDEDGVFAKIEEVNTTEYTDSVLIRFTPIRAAGDPDNKEDKLALLKIFKEPTGGDAGEFVKKTGDTMSGSLTMGDTLQMADGQNTDSPTITFKSKNSSGTIRTASLQTKSSGTTIYASAAFQAGGPISAGGNILYNGSDRIKFGTSSTIHELKVGNNIALQWDSTYGIRGIRAGNSWGSNGKFLTYSTNYGLEWASPPSNTISDYVVNENYRSNSSSSIIKISKTNGNYYITGG